MTSIGDRGRVPFALVGVIILVASTGIAVTLNSASTPTDEATTTAEIRETAAAARNALQGAVRRAGAYTARNPIVTPANTSYGRVIDANASVRSTFRVHIAVAARTALETIGDTTGDVRTHVELSTIDSPTTLGHALDNISIRRHPTQEHSVKVTISNVQIHATHDGRTRATDTIDIALTVETPVLELNDRVRRFEQRLNRSPFDTGFAQQLTTRLYAMAWARGYAQYGGAPIENVVTNRHLEVATNGALLALQRQIFGSSDPRGERVHHEARLRSGVRDLITAADTGLGKWTDTILGHRSIDTPDPGPLTPVDSGNRSSIAVELTRIADDAFAAFVDDTSDTGLHTVIDTVYTASAHIDADTITLSQSQTTETEPTDWTLAATETTTETRVEPTTQHRRSLDNPSEALTNYTRTVTVETTTTKTWRRGRQTTTTSSTETTTYAVNLAVQTGFGQTEHAPDKLTTSAHETQIAPLADTIIDTLISDRGGPDTLARRAVNDSLNTTPVTVDLPVDDTVTDRVYAGVQAIRTTLRNHSFPTNPATVTRRPIAALVQQNIDQWRRDNHDTGGPYDSLVEKARVAAQSQYLDTVTATLQTQKSKQSTVLDGLGDLLAGQGLPGKHLSSIASFLSGVPTTATDPSESIRVTGVPAYLTRAELTNETSPGLAESHYPLATRNVNLVTVPYSDISREVTDAVVDRGSQVSLDTAARALRIANQTMRHAQNTTLTTHQPALVAALRDRLTALNDTVTPVLTNHTSVAASTVDTALKDALRTWDTVHDRINAVRNGSIVPELLERVTTHATVANRTTDRLAVRLRRDLRAWLPDQSLPKQVVSTVADAVTGAARQVLDRTVETALKRGSQAITDRWLGDAVTAAGGGVPLLPVPGYWYATANAWRVQIRGGYARFAVTMPGSSPVNGVADTVEYVRENRSVGIDVDRDGTVERFGDNERLWFSVETAVVIVVPPGQGGVADVDGVRDERSPGWNRSTTTK